MCYPPILSPSFSSPNSLSCPSSSLYSNTNFYPKNSRNNGRSLYRTMAELGPTKDFPPPPPPRFFLNDDTIPDQEEEEEDQVFHDSCFLCKTYLHPNDDVYMYKGDVSFCSEECRQDQIEIDEAKAKSNLKMLKVKLMINNMNSSPKSREIHVLAG